MPKNPETKRIEVHLMPDIVEKLQAKAIKENRSLKNHCETILIASVTDKSTKPKK